jgi:hypothetical protein
MWALVPESGQPSQVGIFGGLMAGELNRILILNINDNH